MLAYAHIHKTAGTTFTGILRRNFSIHHFDARLIPPDRPPLDPRKLKRALSLYPRVDSIAGHAVRPTPELKNAFPEMRFYAFLREPRSRLVSAFMFQKKIEIMKGRWQPASDQEIEETFLGYVDKTRSRLCKILASGVGSADAAIEAIETQYEFVGLVEHFDESLALFRNWIDQPNFDLRYHRMNVSRVGQLHTNKRHAARQQDADRLIAVTRAYAKHPETVARMTDALSADLALFDHVRTNTFERMRRTFSAGPGPFDFEDGTAASDTISGRLYRDLIGRPFVGRYAALGS